MFCLSRSRRSRLAFLCLTIFLIELALPLPLYALSGGPTQPEFGRFMPVATTNMVEEFTGDFTYNLPVINIPGANGGGYALSLSYNSGASVEEEASWVGLGWTLNPGAINRNKRGFPDDWKQTEVEYFNKVPANWTITAGANLNAEAFSTNIPVGLNTAVRFNNYTGFGYSYGLGVHTDVASLGFHVDNGNTSFSLRPNPGKILSALSKKSKGNTASPTPDYILEMESDDFVVFPSSSNTKTKLSPNLSGIASQYMTRLFSVASRPLQSTEYVGVSTSVSVGILGAPSPFQAGPTADVFGSFSIQKNVALDQLSVNGYMYNAEGDENGVMDYSVDKLSSYNKRDLFLGVPISGADYYFLSGEGLSGSFRMHHKRPGHYRPNRKVSHTALVNAGIDAEIGLNIGGGGNLGLGYHRLTVDQWDSPTSFERPENPNTDEPILFRFNNDPGGGINFYDDDLEEQAAPFYENNLPGARKVGFNLPEGIQTTLNNGNRSTRSSYIGHTLNKDFSQQIGGFTYNAYNQQEAVNAQVNRESIGEQIGEFSVVNETGQRYIYGLPVFSRQEKNLQFGLADVLLIDSGYVAYKDVFPIDNQKTIVGEIRKAPYATQYLLTEITDVDYIDRTNNGPSDDDFGGWTKFSYAQKYGSEEKVGAGGNWYKWRVPYNGLLFNRNSLSDPRDDLGMLVEGEKEIYYLQTIETKTHIARFVVSEREDGYSATTGNTASSQPMAKGSQKLSKLDRIELFAKDSNGEERLIKTVRFQYDYSLCGSVPNNSGLTIDQGGADINENKGKLTLRKVWFEYQGVVEAKISPYEFGYSYPLNSEYPERYSDLINYGQGLHENPDYSPFAIDAWGNNQENGGKRFEEMTPWVNQTPPASFDPAAWQLKTITLPSGGQIHVQYEQDDYQYVQDKLAHVMVSLKSGPNSSSDFFYLDHKELGLTDNELLELAALIQDMYVDKGRRLFFKFLYRLIGDEENPLITDCNADYITGYVQVKRVGVEIESGANNDRVYLQLGKPASDNNAGVNYELPLQVCKEFVKTQRNGLLSINGGICNPDLLGINPTGDPVEAVLAGSTIFNAYGPLTGTCKSINLDLSYLRVPSIKAKKGGGVRVKRLLMFDPGIEEGANQLFGNEYIYETRNDKDLIISSGVATNEPQVIRDENILIDFLPRAKQSFVGKVIAGIDRKQSEGAIGEPLLPSPSVGYSKVIVKSIHSGQTNPGISVKEFFTCREHPFAYEETVIDKSKKDFLPLDLLLVNYSINNKWLTQGYSFMLNAMHGQIKSEASYGGDYQNVHDTASLQKSAGTEYEYFAQDEEVEYWQGWGQPLRTGDLPGKEEEVVYASRKVSDITYDASAEVDVSVGLMLPLPVIIPFYSISPRLSYTESQLYTHTTVKINSYPAILKRMVVYKDGIYHTTTNKAFDPATGRAVITETTDGYDKLEVLNATHSGMYTSYDMPAHYRYSETGSPAASEKKWVYSNADVRIRKRVHDDNAYLNFSSDNGSSVCDLMGSFTPGDFVHLDSRLFHLGEPNGSIIPLLPVNDGDLGSDDIEVNVRIVRSGKTNQLNTSIGNVTTYGSAFPVQPFTIPIPDDIMQDRIAVAELLNNAVSNGYSITTDMLPLNLSFKNQDGSCAPLPSDCIIKFEDGTLRIIGLDIPVGVTVVGTPANPHPMVHALNTYFTTFLNFNLSPDQEGTSFECDGGPGVLELAVDTRPDIMLMRQQQRAILNQEFSCVNNAQHRIADFFADVDIEDGTALTRLDDGVRRNRRVVLRSLETGVEFGIYNTCNDFLCNPSCSPDVRSDEVCDEYKLSAYPSFSQSADGYLTMNSLDGSSCTTNIRFVCHKEVAENVKCIVDLDPQGRFSVDPENGQLVFYTPDNSCYPQPQHCLLFCDEVYPVNRLNNVIASSAILLDDYWPYDEDQYRPSPLIPKNEYQTGVKGKWRLLANYTYRTDIRGLEAPYSEGVPYIDATDDEKNYNSGTYILDLFNWKYPQANDSNRWLRMQTVTQCSPNGNALEEVDILGINSCAKFGYSKTLPYLIAQNSPYSSMYFESFENTYEHNSNSLEYLEDGRVLRGEQGVVINDKAHSGKQSLLLKNAPDGFDLSKIYITPQLHEKGLWCKVWIAGEGYDRKRLTTALSLIATNGNDQQFARQFDVVAQRGEWILVEAKWDDLESWTSIGEDIALALKFDFNSSGIEQVWVDDVRIQPLDAQASCYVYDVGTHRLITSFDDQHFGLYYQYNDEGQLVRKLIETERGMKTVQETQYNTPKRPRQ